MVLVATTSLLSRTSQMPSQKSISRWDVQAAARAAAAIIVVIMGHSWLLLHPLWLAPSRGVLPNVRRHGHALKKKRLPLVLGCRASASPLQSLLFTALRKTCRYWSISCAS